MEYKYGDIIEDKNHIYMYIMYKTEQYPYEYLPPPCHIVKVIHRKNSGWANPGKYMYSKHCSDVTKISGDRLLNIQMDLL